MDIRNLMNKARAATVKPVPAAGPKHLKWVLLESLLLEGEKILLVFEKCDLKEARAVYPDVTIYFPPEVEALFPFKGDEDLLRTVNTIKKRFKGWVVPSKCIHSPGENRE